MNVSNLHLALILATDISERNKNTKKNANFGKTFPVNSHDLDRTSTHGLPDVYITGKLNVKVSPVSILYYNTM